jgi:hypothetical protein
VVKNLFTRLVNMGLLQKFGIAACLMFVSTLTFAEDTRNANGNISANSGVAQFMTSPWVLVACILIFVFSLIASLKDGSRREAH